MARKLTAQQHADTARREDLVRMVIRGIRPTSRDVQDARRLCSKQVADALLHLHNNGDLDAVPYGC